MVDEEGLLRVGGRLKKSTLKDDAKCPVILPSKDLVVDRIVWSAHEEDAHQGVVHTQAKLRTRWWIVKGRQRVKSVLSRCVKCKRIKTRPGGQVMSDRPECQSNILQVSLQPGCLVSLEPEKCMDESENADAYNSNFPYPHVKSGEVMQHWNVLKYIE